VITFGDLLDRVMISLGDATGATWDREDVIWDWIIDAIKELPFYIPSEGELKHDLNHDHEFTLPAATVSVVAVEYPIDQDPPAYLVRKSHFEPNFFNSDSYYDVDRHFTSGEGLRLWTSAALAVDAEVRVSYLARHNTTYAAEATETDIEDQYINLIVLYVVWLAWQERLSVHLQDPTAYTNVIAQVTQAMDLAKQNYLNAVIQAIQEQVHSRYVQGWRNDKYDRIY